MPRLAAWDCLRSGSIAPLQEVERACSERELGLRDRALVRRLVGTAVRRRGTLRALTAHFCRRKTKPELVTHLHLGLIQLFFMDRIPDHAALSVTLEAVHLTLGQSKVRAASGILQAARRARTQGSCGDPRRDLVGRDLCLAEPVFRDPNAHPLLWVEDALSLPAALAKRWRKRHGEEVMIALARQALEEPDLAVRACGVDREALAAELGAAACRPEPGAHPLTLHLPSEDAGLLIASEAFVAGRATVQGETALRAAELVGAQEGEEVLDLCAAPGGKTAVLAAAGARVTACDLQARRLERLRQTLERLGLTERVSLHCSDGLAGLDPAASFDAALVDAPCSNTGVLAARPGARWRYGPANQASLTELQARLLEEAAARVRPGGRLVWSTCSLEPEENGQRVRSFLAEHGDWELEEELLTLPQGSPGPVDGGYAARLRRSP